MNDEIQAALNTIFRQVGWSGTARAAFEGLFKGIDARIKRIEEQNATKDKKENRRA